MLGIVQLFCSLWQCCCCMYQCQQLLNVFLQVNNVWFLLAVKSQSAILFGYITVGGIGGISCLACCLQEPPLSKNQTWKAVRERDLSWQIESHDCWSVSWVMIGHRMATRVLVWSLELESPRMWHFKASTVVCVCMWIEGSVDKGISVLKVKCQLCVSLAFKSNFNSWNDEIHP